jgi:hypothetical protein
MNDMSIKGGCWSGDRWVDYSGSIYQNSLGCFVVEFSHYMGNGPDFRKNTKTHILPLNGSGKNKARRKIEGYLHSFYK